MRLAVPARSGTAAHRSLRPARHGFRPWIKIDIIVELSGLFHDGVDSGTGLGAVVCGACLLQAGPAGMEQQRLSACCPRVLFVGPGGAGECSHG